MLEGDGEISRLARFRGEPDPAAKTEALRGLIAPVDRVEELTLAHPLLPRPADEAHLEFDELQRVKRHKLVQLMAGTRRASQMLLSTCSTGLRSDPARRIRSLDLCRTAQRSIVRSLTVTTSPATMPSARRIDFLMGNA